MKMEDMRSQVERVTKALTAWDKHHPNVPYAGATTHRTLPPGAKDLRGFGPKSLFTICHVVRSGQVVVNGVTATVEKYLDASGTRRSRIRLSHAPESVVTEVTSAPARTRARKTAPTAVRATPKVAPSGDGILDPLIERVTEAVIKRLISALTQ